MLCGTTATHACCWCLKVCLCSGAQVANACCQGRLVSVLEGGYRIQGGPVSAFARSVAAHVHALAEPSFQAGAAHSISSIRSLQRPRHWGLCFTWHHGKRTDAAAAPERIP